MGEHRRSGGRACQRLKQKCMCVWEWKGPPVKKPEFGVHLESCCLNSWNGSVQKCTSESKMVSDKRGFAS